MRSFSRTAAVFATVSLLGIACGGDDAGAPADTTANDTTADEPADEHSTDGGASELSGTVQLDGSSTVGPLSEVAAELYMAESGNDVRVTVAISGTGGGFEKFCRGETDANNSSRPIREDEAELCASNGIAYDFVQAANDALSILVNNDAPVACLTVEQVSAIWDADSTIATWGDIPGLDLPADFTGEPLTLYGPGTDSGTFDYFTEEINGEVGRIRTDYIDIGEDDNAAVTAVQGDIGAIGYVPFSYFQEAPGTVKAVDIDNGEGCIESSPENVENLTYAPLGRGLFVYFSDTALDRAEVLDFAEFYIENAQRIAELAEFVPMSDRQIAAQREKIATLVAG